MHPYFTLGVTEQDDNAAIRKAYLEAVKNNPPDRFPDRFREINTAYELIKNETSRAEFELFDRDPGLTSPFEALISDWRIVPRRNPPTLQAMKEHVRQCLKTK